MRNATTTPARLRNSEGGGERWGGGNKSLIPNSGVSGKGELQEGSQKNAKGFNQRLYRLC